MSKMRLTIFALVFMLLAATGSLAAGIEITEIDVHVDYDEAYTYRIDDKDRADTDSVPVANNSKINADVLPGSNITFTVRVANTFQGEEPDLRDAFVTITLEEMDDGADLDEQSADFDLEPGNDYRTDVKFAVPLDVDESTYNVVVEAEGEDKNETLYKTQVNLKLEVKKQSHDIRIKNVMLAPGVVDCDRKARLAAEIINAGSNAESQIALEFKSAVLGVNSYDRDIFLDSSEEASAEEKTYSKILNIEVPPFFKSGTYPISVNLYWKNFVLFDQKNVDLAVRDCGAGVAQAQQPKPAEEKKEKMAEVTAPKKAAEEKEAKKQPLQEELVTATQEISILNSPMLLAAFLGMAIIIMLAVLIAYVYLKKSNKL